MDAVKATESLVGADNSNLIPGAVEDLITLEASPKNAQDTTKENIRKFEDNLWDDEMLDEKPQDEYSLFQNKLNMVYDQCMIEKKKHPEMFVSGFEVDETGIEPALDPNSPEEKFLKAAEDGDMETLEAIFTSVQNPGTLLSHKDMDGYSAIHRAAYSDHPEIIRYLYDNNIDIETKTDEGWTALHCACHWNHHRSVRELIGCFANVNAQTSGGQTPLHVASFQQGRESMVVLLTAPGIEPDIKNSNGETALDIARRSGRFAYLFEYHDPIYDKIS